ncbi:exo-alpha-sialidase [Dyella sp. 2HG41-7]|uniref:exo-alpha-sialidase n=1 Tax=Dyella sp. 2HG41-7 TaxID=2883239 RepID=UPI001F459ECE|nr:exo-alpha-sialidase [Dyella sp. 2HG41-7]
MRRMACHLASRVGGLLFVMAAANIAQAQDVPPDVASGHVLTAGTGYASVVRMSQQSDARADGRLLLVFEQNGMTGVPLYVSNDSGKTWQFMQNVVDQEHAGDKAWQLRWQPHISQMQRDSGDLKRGTLLLAANATRNDERGHVVEEDLQLYASTDQGKSWRYRGSIVKGGGHPEDKDNHGVWEPNVHILDDGRMIAYYSSEQHKREGFNQILAHKLSTDGGKTWGSETMDVAMPGGVERPGMAIVARLSDGRYVMNYEDIDGANNGQVHVKFSPDGLTFGDPADHGTAVQTEGGAWPAACPVVTWFPVGGSQGVIVISAERAGGNGDTAGRSLYWNNDGGRGPWWEVPAPVQKVTGNIHAGWTQALLQQKDGRFLHVTSSSAPQLDQAWKAAYNVMLYADAPLNFDRYEAEDAARTNAVVIGNPHASNRRMARIAAAPYGKLQFDIHRDHGGAHTLRVRYEDIGLPATPRVNVNGSSVAASGSKADGGTGWNVMDVKVDLRDGDNVIVLGGAEHAYDVDYIEFVK